MRPCAACRALQGAPAEVKPHPFLLQESYILHTEGTIYAFHCSACGSRWMRFVVLEHFSGPPQAWERL